MILIIYIYIIIIKYLNFSNFGNIFDKDITEDRLSGLWIIQYYDVIYIYITKLTSISPTLGAFLIVT